VIAVRRFRRIPRNSVRVNSAGVTFLETMSPLDFLSFRDALYPASRLSIGCSSAVLENKLGLTPARRLMYGARPYCSYLSSEDAESVGAAEELKAIVTVCGCYSFSYVLLPKTPKPQISDC